MKKRYSLADLPEELKSFTDYHDAYRKLTATIPGTIKQNWQNYSFAYLFPNGSMCIINLYSYKEHNEVQEWKFFKNLSELSTHNLRYLNFINSPGELLKQTNPYGYKFAKENGFHPYILLAMPKLEQLKKAGFAIADAIIWQLNSLLDENSLYPRHLICGDLQKYLHIFGNGTALYDIIGFPRNIAKEMKSVDNIEIWDSCRKLCKKKLLDTESVQALKEANYTKKEIQNLYAIVNKGIDGKNYFTIPSLLRYLRRVDMYEAIPSEEALQLLADYIRCCHVLEVKPRFDSDSLKREHDVMARNARIKLQEIYNEKQKEKNAKLAEKMKNVCSKLHKYDYKEDVFFIRSIDSFGDLLDEATQQVNCVAGYANSIAEGISKIFVMRETANPDKSLITVELNSNNQLRQKYLSHNRPIYNKAQTEFLKRWMKHIQTIDMEA